MLAGSALAVAALAAGCAAGSTVTVTAPPATTPPATTAAATAPAATTPASAPAASTPTASTSGAAAGNGPQPCSTRYLRAGAGQSQGAAGSIYQVITFTNLDNVACTLYGYPGVSLANGTPTTQVGAAADRNATASPATVTLQPRGVASATLRIVDAGNFPTSKCGPVATTWLQIFPPNQYAPLYLSYKSTGCSDSATHLLMISVVVAGNGG